MKSSSPSGDEWRWPENPTEPRDLIATYFRSWGRALAYQAADELLERLESNEIKVTRQ